MSRVRPDSSRLFADDPALFPSEGSQSKSVQSMSMLRRRHRSSVFSRFCNTPPENVLKPRIFQGHAATPASTSMASSCWSWPRFHELDQSCSRSCTESKWRGQIEGTCCLVVACLHAAGNQSLAAETAQVFGGCVARGLLFETASEGVAQPLRSHLPIRGKPVYSLPKAKRPAGLSLLACVLINWRLPTF